MKSQLVRLIFLALLLVMVACSDNKSGPEPSTGTETPAVVSEKVPTPGALVDIKTIKAPAPGTAIDCTDPAIRSAIILSLLARVPAQAGVETRGVVYRDYECARQLLGIALPAPGAPPPAIMAYRDALLAAVHVWDENSGPVVGHIAGFSLYFDVLAWNTEVGFNAASVDQLLEVNVGPPSRTVHLRGRFDPVAIDSAVHADPAWSGLLETVTYDADIHYYAWGEDRRQYLQNRTPFRPIGQAGRMFVGDGYLDWASLTSEIEAALDASLGKKASFAEIIGYRELVEGLAAASTLSFMVSPRPYSLSDSETVRDIRNEYGVERLDRLYQEGTLGRFGAFAAGTGFESGRFYSVSAYLFADVASARAGTSALAQMLESGHSLKTGEPWASQFERFEVTTIGRTTVARIWGDPRLAADAYNYLDSITLTDHLPLWRSGR